MNCFKQASGKYSNSRCWPFLIVFVLVIGTSRLQAQQLPPVAASPRSVEGELLVKFKGGLRGPGAVRVQQALRHQVRRSFDRLNWQHVRVPAGMTEAQALARYRQHPDVLAVEPNYVFHLRLTETNAALPNDPRFSEQWGLARIGATNAWALTSGSSNVVVAVLDTGLRYTHEDLSASMWRNPGEIPGNLIDDDNNGYVDDLFGIDAVNQDSDPIDQPIGFTFHGTACASIIGATGNNGLGIAGVNWPVRLMALRLAAPSNFIASAWVVECFEYVLTMKSRGINVRVTSNSYGLDDAPSMAVRDAIDAVGQTGILNVFAAGNSNLNVDVTCDYPSCFRLPSMINVAASDMADNLASFSNFGATNVDLAAPGVNIIVADGLQTNAYNPNFNGTSAACPFVAGAAALLAGAYPSASIAQIKSALLESVDQLPAFTNKMVSHGRLNVGRAIFHPGLSVNAPPHILTPPQSQTVGRDYPATFRVIATGAAPLTYFWRFGGNEISVTTEPALTLPSVGLPNEGNYTVVLSNQFGMTTSVVASLTVAIEPTFLAQPQGFRVLDMTNITLAVSAAGAFPLSYQWRRNSQNLPGATEPCLSLNNVNRTMSGDYQVVLSNAHGMRTSMVATVTVFTRPYIVSQPQSRTVAVGANTSLSFVITDAATVPIGVRWLRNGAPAGVLILNNQFTAVTNFQNIQTSAAGRWSALVTNESPTGLSAIMTSNAYVTVVQPLTNQAAMAGSSVSFNALAAGTAPIRYQWQHAGTNIPNATNATLTLNAVFTPDAGLYSVTVINAVGEPTSFQAHLQVNVAQPELSAPQRFPDGRFEMVVLGLVNQQPYAVEISTNLTQWSVLDVFTATNASMPFVDPTAVDAAQRFYRARSNP